MSEGTPGKDLAVFVDATAAGRGGIRTYCCALLVAWAEAFPADRLVIATSPQSIGASFAAFDNVEVLEVAAVRGRRSLRTLQQAFVLGRQAERMGCSSYLAMLPQLPVRCRLPCVAIVYDLWHERRPADFTRSRQLQRRVFYGRSYRKAARLLTISATTRDDLVRFHPEVGSRACALPCGSDHVLSWDVEAVGGRTGAVVAFGHHKNKRPEIALRAWLHLRSRRALPPLVICGLDSDVRDELTSVVSEAGCENEVDLRGFVPDAEFEPLFAAASCILFPSVIEGLGLPVLEAMRLGVPVAITPERALQEAAAGHASVAASDAFEDVAAALERALDRGADELLAATTYAETCTWRSVAAEARSIMAGLTAGG